MYPALKKRCEKETERLKGSKRVKEVFDNAMVAHLWANQSQGSARNATRNFYFDGDTMPE